MIFDAPGFQGFWKVLLCYNVLLLLPTTALISETYLWFMQSVFRGFQVRRQYGKIIWSVGVLEKALFRWRLKRKGFRGLKLQSSQVVHKPDDVEEDFFQASRKQAEERIERSVVRVQAMFRSKQAQEQYRRMKLEHNKATVIVMTIILK